MSLGNTIEFAHVVLRLVAKYLDTENTISLVCKGHRMVDPEVVEIGYIQHIAALLAVGIDDTVRDDFALNDRLNSGSTSA